MDALYFKSGSYSIISNVSLSVRNIYMSKIYGEDSSN